MGMLIVAIYFLGFKEIYSNGIYILDWDSIDMMEFSEIFHGKWDLLSGWFLISDFPTGDIHYLESLRKVFDISGGSLSKSKPIG